MRFTRIHKILLLLSALILISSLIVWIPSQKYYVFIDNESENLAAYIPLESRLFQIIYTHSIHLSEVIESYKVTDDGELMMTELEYEDFNIGMPSNAGEGETFVEKDGKYFIKNMTRKLPEFRLFVGDVDAGLSFKTKGSRVDLKGTLERGKSYTFRVERLSLFQLRKGVRIDER
ncbi:RocC [Planococcus versutus]|uniref:RocC n=1 Tax=Planococcus versutus TaxID=1302659 RepID=A0A1B1S3M6_9BACL|nr:RocC [Planococcus versutus]